MKRVSIIMGIYNCSSTLQNAVESIINQTYTDWELIMCDDNSFDNTLEIATEYANKYTNIKVIKNKKNQGLAYTLNHCLKYATGEYIARMDADDISLPERLEKQVLFLEENSQYDVVGSSVILYDEKGDQAIRNLIEMPQKKDLVKYVPHIHPTILMRKSAYDKLNGYTVSNRTRRGQDADLWFRFYGNGFKGYNLQEPLLKYHESISDYKKRGFKVAINGMKTRFYGYRQLKIPIYYYIFIMKPLIAYLVPNQIMYYYHKRIKGA